MCVVCSMEAKAINPIARKNFSFNCTYNYKNSCDVISDLGIMGSAYCDN